MNLMLAKIISFLVPLILGLLVAVLLGAENLRHGRLANMLWSLPLAIICRYLCAVFFKRFFDIDIYKPLNL